LRVLIGAGVFSATGSLPFQILPFLILSLVSEGRIDIVYAGWVGSAYLIGMLFSTLLLPLFSVIITLGQFSVQKSYSTLAYFLPQQYSGIVPPEERRQRQATRAVLRMVLGRTGFAAADVRIGTGAYGKPCLVDCRAIGLSVPHSGGLSLLAFAPRLFSH
jgi:hypothetical protein